MGTEQLGAAIGLFGVGVHDAARQFDQLAHMADKEDFRKMFCCGHIQRFPNEIGDFYNRDLMQFRVVLGQVIQPIVAGGQNQAAAVQGGLVDFQLQRIQQRLLAHRLYNAAGAQHR